MMINICRISIRRSILPSAIKYVGVTKQNVFADLVPMAKFSIWHTSHCKYFSRSSFLNQNEQQFCRPISTSSCRTFMSNHEVSEGAKIYHGGISKRVRFVKFFSASTSICSLALFPALLLSNDTGGFGILGVVAGSMASVMFFTPFFLHYFTKGYVTKMFLNYETNVYTAYTISFLLRDLKHEFHQKDVQVPSVANLFTSFKANGRSFMVDTQSFNSANDYAHLMGYDKLPDMDMSELLNDKEK
ncbi:transmembrane protein 70 homolog, mitochondrial-like [Anneissia japonica]|uniref:transmembrane protein 70 homolog, mitochondrial-like n=1 Tax=Anneissia japonica TaxID=1529436 RepID=UPI001425AD87|nr:transmembrane protein 70 homolog, mitochondrial-like [Anneissia japonica]